MQRVDVRQAKIEFSRLVDRAAAGEEFLIVESDRPIAKLVPLAPLKRRFGILAGKISVPDDFDRPLPSDVIESFEA